MITKRLLKEEWIINRLSQKEIADKYGVGLWFIENKIRDYGLTGARTKIKYPVNQKHVSLDSPIFWYLVGITISDGYIDEKNKRIVISLTNEKELLEELSSYYSTNVQIPIYGYRTRELSKVRYSLTLSDITLLELFHSIGIYGVNKTSNVRMPDPNSIELFNLLLRGFLDGDGSIKTRGYSDNIHFTFYSHSEMLTSSIVDLFSKYYGLNLKIYDTKGHSGKNVDSGAKAGSYLMKIYSDLPNLSIRRKRNVVKKQVDDIVHRYGMINHNNW